MRGKERRCEKNDDKEEVSKSPKLENEKTSEYEERMRILRLDKSDKEKRGEKKRGEEWRKGRRKDNMEENRDKK